MINYKYKLNKYISKKNKLLTKIHFGGNYSLSVIDFVKKLESINKIKKLEIPTDSDIGIQLFDTNFFIDDKFIYNDAEIIFRERKKIDDRQYDENELVIHHVNQHLYRISDSFLYTYNLRTCSAIILLFEGIVGMMHVDIHNTLNDGYDFINDFKLRCKVDDKILFKKLKIFTFINPDSFEQVLSNSPFGALLRLIDNGFSIENIYFSDEIDPFMYIFIIPNRGLYGFIANEIGNIPKYVIYHQGIKILQQHVKSNLYNIIEKMNIDDKILLYSYMTNQISCYEAKLINYENEDIDYDLYNLFNSYTADDNMLYISYLYELVISWYMDCKEMNYDRINELLFIK